MSGLDVFKGEGFSLRSMTAAINTRPFVPGRIGAMGLFRQFGITTTTAQIEVKDGVLYLIEARPRGAPAKRNEDEGRKLVPINAVHLPVEDRLHADEVQNIRAFGTDTQMETINAKVMEKLGTIRQSFEATLEYHRMGAINGVILDADGNKVLYNLYDVFGVEKLPTVFFNLSESDPEAGSLRTKSHVLQRSIEDELGAIPYGGIHAFVGSEFMDLIVSHAETIKAWERWQDGQALRESYARRTFFYAGIMYEEYRGKVGSIDYIPADEARFFPTGAPGLFDVAFAPANYLSTVNTNGLPFYAKQTVDPKDRWVDIDAQSNPVHYCTRPRVLVTGKAGSA